MSEITSDQARQELVSQLRTFFPLGSQMHTIDLIMLLAKKGKNPDLKFEKDELGYEVLVIDNIKLWVYKPDGLPYSIANEPNQKVLEKILKYIA